MTYFYMTEDIYERLQEKIQKNDESILNNNELLQ